MLRAFHSEWILLNRPRMWLVLAAVTTVFTAGATWLVLATAPESGPVLDSGVTVASLELPGGATTAVVSSVAFSAILVLAAFASSAGNEMVRGTWRVACTRQPRRLSLLGGKLAARLTVALAAMVLALAVGWVTALLIAPGEGIDTAAWWGADAARSAAEDLVRLGAFVGLYAVIGTLLAMIARSTPVALGVGLLWFGPLENVVGEGRDWAYRWFPGLLMRAVLMPDLPGGVGTGRAMVTLAIYLVVAVTGLVLLTSRRDVVA